MAQELAVEIGERDSVTAIHYPAAAPRLRATLVLAHGAGADQRHAFMVERAQALAGRGLDVVTFNFSYTEHQRGAPDRAPQLEACWRAVIAHVGAHAPLAGNALVIGGKSMGGRIASQVAATGIDGLLGLVFFGYPLHPPKRPDQLRIAHLPSVRLPMLFVQGERDPFGTPGELAPILAPLAPSPVLHTVAYGDHSLKVPKKAGVAQAQVYADVEEAVARFVQTVIVPSR